MIKDHVGLHGVEDLKAHEFIIKSCNSRWIFGSCRGERVGKRRLKEAR